MLGLTVFCALASQEKNELKKTEWLLGVWENKTTKGSVYEMWSKINHHELQGKGYLIKEKDTTVFETIQIIQEPNSLFYIPTVKNQNSSLPVRFEAISVSETKLVFVNLQHDFPQSISYRKINSDSLIAEILGTKNGQKHKQIFPMKRVQ